MVAKKLLSKKINVYTIAPVEVGGAKQIESLDQLSKVKLVSSASIAPSKVSVNSPETVPPH